MFPSKTLPVWVGQLHHCLQCVYKRRLAPHNFAHEPTPKKPGEFEERFSLLAASAWECVLFVSMYVTSERGCDV